MKMYVQKIKTLTIIASCFVLLAFLSSRQTASAQENTSLLAPETLSAEKAKLLGHVENHITNKFPPMLRRTVEWGNAIKNKKNQYTIRYQCEAVVINSNECLLYCWDFTFDEVGNFVNFSKVAGFPKRPSKPFLKVASNDNEKINSPKPTPKENTQEVKVSAADFKEGAAAFEKGNSAMKKNDYANAEIHFKEAFRLNPNNYSALLELGNAQFKQQLNDDAQKTFIKCTEMRPRDSRPLEILGLIAQTEGNEEKMIEWWKKSVDVDKNSNTALKGLGAYYAEKGDTKNASMYYRIYLRSNTQDKEIKAALEQLKNK
jgi:tetratricopeptide (TPR) repeat protein